MSRAGCASDDGVHPDALGAMIDLLNEASDPWVEQVMAHPMDEIVATFVDMRRFLFGLADEARELLAAGR